VKKQSYDNKGKKLSKCKLALSDVPVFVVTNKQFKINIIIDMEIFLVAFAISHKIKKIGSLSVMLTAV